MQPELLTDAVYGIPSLILGFGFGYVVGAMKSFKLSDRLLIGLASSAIGGLAIVLALTTFLPFSASGTILSILAFAGGFIFGAGIHWVSPAKPKSKFHIIYEPENDDEFDREIEKVFEPNNQ